MRITHSAQPHASGAERPSRPADPDRTPRRPRTGAALRMTAAAMVVLLAAACGSSKKTTTPPPSAPASATATATASASAGASATGGAPADQAAAKTQITTNWEKFFDPNTPLSQKATVLQHGDALTKVLEAFKADPQVSQVKAKVTNIAFTSATQATVTYDLSLGGQVALPGATGQAVLDNGTWKVSTSTLCALVKLSGNSSVPSIPGCS